MAYVVWRAPVASELPPLIPTYFTSPALKITFGPSWFKVPWDLINISRLLTAGKHLLRWRAPVIVVDGLLDRRRLEIGFTDQQSDRSHHKRWLIRARFLHFRLNSLGKLEQHGWSGLVGHTFSRFWLRAQLMMVL